MNYSGLDCFRVKCNFIAGVEKSNACSIALESATCYNYEQTIQNEVIRYTYCDGSYIRVVSPLTFALFLLSFIIWHVRNI